MNPRLAEQLATLPETFSHHLFLSLLALFTGVLICFPLAILISRVKALQWPALTFASVVQTIPGLALLALMVPLLGRIGFLPAFLALVLYSMLPILHNTVSGLVGLDRSILEAARGIGMSRAQQLLQVELPLAAPVIVAGIRTSAVWIVGTATLATPVGATSLGNHIFSGLQTQNPTAVLVGCFAAAALAVTLDQLIGWLQRATEQRSRRKVLAAGISLLCLFLVGLVPLASKWGAHREVAAPTVVVGAKTFTEQYVLAEVLKLTLKQAGLEAESKSSLGSTIVFDAVVKGEIDCYIDYSGTLWANLMKRTDVPVRGVVIEELTRWLQERHQVRLLGTLGFENTYALAIPAEAARRDNISTVAELSPHTPKLRIGSDYEFFGRPEWRSLKEKYGLRFAEQRTFDPSLMYAAIKAKSVDVISAYSTDGRIIDYNLVVLKDPKGALPPYDAVLLLSSAAARRAELVAALSPLLGRITDDTIRRANELVDLQGRSIPEAAAFVQKAVHSTSIPISP
jgi:osmoprotectant transport system substrate-binding protein/osmoprotectant transport system permease protein